MHSWYCKTGTACGANAVSLRVVLANSAHLECLDKKILHPQESHGVLGREPQSISSHKVDGPLQYRGRGRGSMFRGLCRRIDRAEDRGEQREGLPRKTNERDEEECMGWRRISLTGSARSVQSTLSRHLCKIAEANSRKVESLPQRTLISTFFLPTFIRTISPHSSTRGE